jgi:hypothetical protein
MRPTLTVIVDPADRWMSRAACIGQAPAYDEDASRWEQRKARELCLTSCPVLAECRDWARRVPDDEQPRVLPAWRQYLEWYDPAASAAFVVRYDRPSHPALITGG